MSSSTDLHIDDSATVRAGNSDTPMLILMHGYGSNEQDLATLAPYLPDGLATASVRAPITLTDGAYAWVPVGVPGRPDPAMIAASTAAMLTWIDTHVPADRQLSLLGFSQGGLMVSQLLRARPTRFACGVLLAGFVLDAVLEGDSALAARRPPLFYGRGSADTVISATAVERAVEWLPRHVDLTQKIYPGLGHGISPEELSDIVAYLQQHALP